MRSKKPIMSKQKINGQNNKMNVDEKRSSFSLGKLQSLTNKSSMDSSHDQNEQNADRDDIIQLKNTSQQIKLKVRNSIYDIDKKTLTYLQNALQLKANSLSSRDLAFIFNIQQKMMNNLINKYKNQGYLIKKQFSPQNVNSLDKLKRPLKLTIFIQRLIQILKLDPRLSVQQIQRIFEKYYNCTTNQGTIVRYINQINQMKQVVNKLKLSKQFIKLKTQ